MPTEPGTIEALLAAGRTLFAERGYDGASVRALTTTAGANLGAITYHFGSKQAFYDQVVSCCVQPLIELVEEVAGGAGGTLDRVEEVVRAIYGHLRSHPELPRLMMQELAVRHTPPAAVIEPIRRMHGALVSLVREGQASGEIREGDPVVMVVSIVSQPIHFGLVGQALAPVMGVYLEEPASWERVVRNAVDFVRAGLAASPGRA
jgi:AcrR family transcriptional regulator